MDDNYIKFKEKKDLILKLITDYPCINVHDDLHICIWCKFIINFISRHSECMSWQIPGSRPLHFVHCCLCGQSSRRDKQRRVFLLQAPWGSCSHRAEEILEIFFNAHCSSGVCILSRIYLGKVSSHKCRECLQFELRAPEVEERPTHWTWWRSRWWYRSSSLSSHKPWL